MIKDQKFGFFLVKKRIIDMDMLSEALEIQAALELELLESGYDLKDRKKLGEILRDDFNVFDDDKLYELLAEHKRS